VSLFGRPGDLNRQFIARPDTAKEDMLFKWPDLTIRKFTQVTVEPDETAIFFKDGKVAGILPQGRSALDGTLIPFLGDIVDFASGGNMYRAELYFVGTRQASNELITDWAREQILKTLRTSVVRKLLAEKWSVLGIAARTADIESAEY
jgi:hypothetical protein